MPSGGVVTAPATSSAAASVKAPKVSDGAKSNASTTAETSKWGNEGTACSGYPERWVETFGSLFLAPFQYNYL